MYISIEIKPGTSPKHPIFCLHQTLTQIQKKKNISHSACMELGSRRICSPKKNMVLKEAAAIKKKEPLHWFETCLSTKVIAGCPRFQKYTRQTKLGKFSWLKHKKRWWYFLWYTWIFPKKNTKLLHLGKLFDIFTNILHTWTPWEKFMSSPGVV